LKKKGLIMHKQTWQHYTKVPKEKQSVVSKKQSVVSKKNGSFTVTAKRTFFITKNDLLN